MNKNIFKTIISLILILGLAGCTTKVDENGLSKNITKILPDSVYTKMMNMGMPINGGNQPPELEGTYNVSPFILDSSDVEGDYRGKSFSDFVVTFHNFNSRKLTVEIDYVNGPETGTGVGSYIVGHDNKFSVFCEIKATQLLIFHANAIFVLTGTLTNDGIDDFYYANFMLDNHGNEEGLWIDNGSGRIIYDSDGFSERTDILTKAKPSENKYKSALSK